MRLYQGFFQPQERIAASTLQALRAGEFPCHMVVPAGGKSAAHVVQVAEHLTTFRCAGERKTGSPHHTPLGPISDQIGTKSGLSEAVSPRPVPPSSVCSLRRKTPQVRGFLSCWGAEWRSASWGGKPGGAGSTPPGAIDKIPANKRFPPSRQTSRTNLGPNARSVAALVGSSTSAASRPAGGPHSRRRAPLLRDPAKGSAPAVWARAGVGTVEDVAAMARAGVITLGLVNDLARAGIRRLGCASSMARAGVSVLGSVGVLARAGEPPR